MIQESKIGIFITHVDDPNLPASDRYLAQIKEGEYDKTLVTAGSIPELFVELSKSMWVMDDYRKRLKSKP